MFSLFFVMVITSGIHSIFKISFASLLCTWFRFTTVAFYCRYDGQNKKVTTLFEKLPLTYIEQTLGTPIIFQHLENFPKKTHCFHTRFYTMQEKIICRFQPCIGIHYCLLTWFFLQVRFRYIIFFRELQVRLSLTQFQFAILVHIFQISFIFSIFIDVRVSFFNFENLLLNRRIYDLNDEVTTLPGYYCSNNAIKGDN